VPSALVIRHERHEGLAGLTEPVLARGYSIDELYAGETEFASADLLSPDLVILMGGGMGVYEREKHPWIDPEIVRLCERIAADRPTLGICLGSQLMAAAMGARVYKGPVREVGFFPIAMTESGRRSAVSHISGTPMLQWHGDTFELPEGAVRLAYSASYENQAFSRGDNILGVQFHAEMGEDAGFSYWCRDGAYVASAGTDVTTLAADYNRLGPAAVSAGRAMVDAWLAGLDV